MRFDGESVSHGQEKEGKETRGIDDAGGKNAPPGGFDGSQRNCKTPDALAQTG
jgi:hypothetical protein